ncbi:HTTM domain-containing protein [Halonotius terrestris]|uniref:HTTM domain-containing protein n=1 Tax=Halonotius terrestris TaxID=2487750 RepID=A0A8J8PC03_9EURY|nr:HTTM domain-containing protein [Halonotius terrestris]TQQ81043.1 HTTM domain-containing protein [Halonotius terrestris]
MSPGSDRRQSRGAELTAPAGRLAPFTSRLRDRLRVDTRSLAALRILLGSILLIDLAHRAGAIAKYYTDSGVYPVAAYEVSYTQFTGFSIHALSGALWFQQLLFLIAGLFALAFVVGYRTRPVGFCSFVLLVSLHARNPAVLNGGDILLRTFLPLTLLTPLGERWSIDALRRGEYRETVLTAATTAVLAQPLVVFGQNAVLKHGGDTWYSGEALKIAFANDEMTVFLGNYLSAYPTLLEALNWGWVTLLAGSTVFLLFTAGRLRAAVVLVYIGAFLGMLPTLMVGLFPLVLTASVVAYLPPVFWDVAARLVPDSVTSQSSTTRLGPLAGPPLETRLYDALRQQGYGSVVDYSHAYGRSLLTILGVFALAFVLVFGVGHVAVDDVPYEDEATAILDQSWGLYAPNPTDSYSWFITNATLENGSTVAAFGEGPSFDRPPDAAATYESFRERKFMSAVSSDRDGTIGTSYAEWACRQAADRYDQPVESITLYRMFQDSPVDGEYDEPFRRTLIEHDCTAG